ncbi:MAG: hypothetical protein HY551_01180 [Elusimicrobia bacterium]|nr:hypothetical protein [Elusimicrobiota bacterium]
MSDKFNLSQLTQEIISSQLKGSPDAPSMAAEIAKKTIVAGVRGTQTSGQIPQETVEQICLGAMKGLLLLEKDLPKAAVHILNRMAEASSELHMDPEEMMTWAMRGISRITPLVSTDIRWNIQRAIEDQYMGAGEVFARLCGEISS